MKSIRPSPGKTGPNLNGAISGKSGLSNATSGSKIISSSDLDKPYSIGKTGTTKDSIKSYKDALTKTEPRNSSNIKLPSLHDNSEKISRDYVKVPTIKKKN